ncbi:MULTISPECIES: hypothetical protein [unclassified Anabaena]|nr:hypothetical protein [Anabaena sp. UHCC 0399]MEA5569110.1 hypothetical protein [Anabaena sp. UHCC 0399]
MVNGINLFGVDSICDVVRVRYTEEVRGQVTGDREEKLTTNDS